MEKYQKLTVEEIAYIAGFFDGEGYLGIADNQGLRLIVSISNTKFEILHWLKDLFGGSIYVRQRSGSNHKPIHIWTIVSREATLFLCQIQPYLRMKDEVAQLGIDFQNTKDWGGYNSKNLLPEDVIDYRCYLREKVMELNHRGMN